MLSDAERIDALARENAALAAALKKRSTCARCRRTGVVSAKTGLTHETDSADEIALAYRDDPCPECGLDPTAILAAHDAEVRKPLEAENAALRRERDAERAIKEAEKKLLFAEIEEHAKTKRDRDASASVCELAMAWQKLNRAIREAFAEELCKTMPPETRRGSDDS